MKNPVTIFARKQLFRKPPKPPSFGLRLLVSFGMLVISLLLVFCTSAPSGHLSDIEAKSKEVRTRTITVSESDVKKDIVDVITDYTNDTRPLILWGINLHKLVAKVSNELPNEADKKYLFQTVGKEIFKINVPTAISIEDYVEKIIPKKDDSDTIEEYFERITGKKKEKEVDEEKEDEEVSPPKKTKGKKKRNIPKKKTKKPTSKKITEKVSMKSVLETCFRKSTKSIYGSGFPVLYTKEIKINLNQLMKYFSLVVSDSDSASGISKVPNAELTKKIWNELLFDDSSLYKLKVIYPKDKSADTFVVDLAAEYNHSEKSNVLIDNGVGNWQHFMSLATKKLSAEPNSDSDKPDHNWITIYNSILNYGIDSSGTLLKRPKNSVKLTKKKFQDEQLIDAKDASLFYISMGEFNIYEGISEDSIVDNYFSIIASTIIDKEKDNPINRFLNLIKEAVSLEKINEAVSREEILDQIDPFSLLFTTKTITADELIGLVNERIVRPSLQASEQKIIIEDAKSPFKMIEGNLICDNFPYFDADEKCSDGEIFKKYVKYTAKCPISTILFKNSSITYIYKMVCEKIWKKENLNDYKDISFLVKDKSKSSTKKTGGSDKPVAGGAGAIPKGGDSIPGGAGAIPGDASSMSVRTSSVSKVAGPVGGGLGSKPGGPGPVPKGTTPMPGGPGPITKGTAPMSGGPGLVLPKSGSAIGGLGSKPKGTDSVFGGLGSVLKGTDSVLGGFSSKSKVAIPVSKVAGSVSGKPGSMPGGSSSTLGKSVSISKEDGSKIKGLVSISKVSSPSSEGIGPIPKETVLIPKIAGSVPEETVLIPEITGPISKETVLMHGGDELKREEYDLTPKKTELISEEAKLISEVDGSMDKEEGLEHKETKSPQGAPESTDQSDKDKENQSFTKTAATRNKETKNELIRMDKGKQTNQGSKNKKLTDNSKEKEQPVWLYYVAGAVLGLALIGFVILFYSFFNYVEKLKLKPK